MFLKRLIFKLSKIRVTYSGLIALVTGLISVLTGIIFTLIVTRKLSPDEFGTWSIIGTMISYFLIVEPIISFWSTRQIARGDQVGKTSLISSTGLSIGVIPLYLILVYYISFVNHSEINAMLFASILLPLSFVSQTLSGINSGYRPHTNSYGLLVFESLKIPTGLVLVYFLDLGVIGAIMTTSLAYVGKIIIQLYFAKDQLKNRFQIAIIKKWIKLLWIPLYSYVAHIIFALDVVIYSVITSSVKGVAYYSASLAVAAILGNAGLISQAIYPKLLAKGSHDHVQANFMRLMYFALPLLGISVIFAKPALFALNPVYSNGWIIAVILSFRTIFYVITTTIYQILLGIEAVDVEHNQKFSKLIKSKLFLIPTLTNIQYGLYIVVLSVTIFLLYSNGTSELELVMWWSVVSLITQIPFFIYACFLLRKNIQFFVPYYDILKYISCTILFGIVYFFTSGYIISYQRSIFEFLPRLILELGICICVYLLATYMIDKNTRILFKSIFAGLK